MVVKIVTWYNYLHMYPDGYIKNGIDLTNIVFYVGKGQKARIDEHEKEAQTECGCDKCQVIREIWANGYPVKKRLVFETLDEAKSLENEKSLIIQNAGEYLTNKMHNDLYWKSIAKKSSERSLTEGLNKQDANVLRAFQLGAYRYGVTDIQRIRGRAYLITINGESCNVIVVTHSFAYYELQYHIAHKKPDMIICYIHDTSVPIPVVSMRGGKFTEAYGLPEEITDIEAQRFTKTGSRVLLGMYISGVKYAQDLVKKLNPTTKSRYLQKAHDLSKRKRGRPVDTQKQQAKH